MYSQMRNRVSWALCGLATVAFLSSCSGRASHLMQSAQTTLTGKPRNIILFIGDGMGPAEVASAAAKKFGQERDALGNPMKLSFEAFPAVGYLTTSSANSFITDSAAAITALACGRKTDNGTIGLLPDGTSVENVADIAKRKGKAVGVMSSVGLNHATPAGFYAHVKSRNNYNKILQQFFDQDKIDLLMGGGVYGDEWTDAKIHETAAAKGYKVFDCKNAASLTAENVSDSKVFGYFDTNGNHQLDFEATRERDNPEPHLSDLTVRAVNILSRDPNGFFLMVEGGAIDWACHGNKPEEAIGETLEFARAIQETVDTLNSNGLLDSTLIIVTADHETGGMALNGPYGKTLPAGQQPEIKWTSNNHTAIPVYVWARGPLSNEFVGKNDNTFVERVIARALQ